LQYLADAPLVLLSITQNSKVQIHPGHLHSPYFPPHLFTLALLTSLARSLPLPWPPSWRPLPGLNTPAVLPIRDIDGSHLPSLTKDDFLDLGVTRVGHRMNIERALKKLTDSSPMHVTSSPQDTD
uniref:SAM domain-containing protein n=1 Tax=Neogobius melanostomus TaxID=47308 RepID=A0A8C6S319_9GOBI